MPPFARVIRPVTLSLITLGATVSLTGCLKARGFLPESNWYLSSRDLSSYISTSWMPQTVTIVDSRTGEAIWSVDVPVGRQVTIDFNTGGGTDEYYPDTMRWGFFAAGTGKGPLPYRMAVPPASARVIEPTLRPAPEWPGETYTPGEVPDPIILPPIRGESEGAQ
ncbi:MAG: hypothetical protein ACF8GE_06235 [Phycisphaerales bacterium JB043]